MELMKIGLTINIPTLAIINLSNFYSNCNQDIYDHYYGIYKTLNRKKIWGKFSRLFLFIFFWIALAIFWIIMSALD